MAGGEGLRLRVGDASPLPILYSYIGSAIRIMYVYRTYSYTFAVKMDRERSGRERWRNSFIHALHSLMM